MTEHPREFVVQRSKWLRGRGAGVLLDEHGSRCCLGFVSAQCGVADAALLDRAAPNSIVWTQREWIAGVLVDGRRHTQLARETVEINDSTDFEDEDRERLLVMLFEKHGYALRFEP